MIVILQSRKMLNYFVVKETTNISLEDKNDYEIKLNLQEKTCV